MPTKSKTPDEITYEDTGTALVATLPDGRTCTVSTRLPMRKLLTIAKRFGDMEGQTFSSDMEAIAAVEDIMPADLLDDETLDFTEALDIFQNWAGALIERAGKVSI